MGNRESLEQFLAFSNTTYTLEFCEKLLDLTHFVLKFYKIETPLSQRENIEKILLLNLNANF